MNGKKDSQADTGTSNPAQAAQGSTCPSCGAVVAAGVKFCGNCGKPMARFCENCGSPLQPGVKFCGECGTPTGSAAPQGGMAPSPGSGGASVASRIRDYIRKTVNDTGVVVTGDDLTPEFLEFAGLEAVPGETPLLALKIYGASASNKLADKMGAQKGKFGGIFDKAAASFKESWKAGTMMITDRRVVWAHLRKDSVFAQISNLISGDMALDAVHDIGIEKKSSLVVERNLIVNGKKIGLIRFSAGLTADSKTLDYLDKLFSTCFGN